MDLFSIQSYPKTVRFAIYSLLGAWATFLWSVHQYYAPEFLMRFAIAGALVIFFLLRIKNWARMLCLCANALAIFNCSLYGLYFATKATPNIVAAFFSALTTILFLGSSYFLLVKSTRDFYKTLDPPGPGPFPTEDPKSDSAE
ncbi:MAG: hypothetical protein QNJ22_01665 [Desulfosarcinaceae bacterium]|nr:hypothetical protein [Desulfosarcinaceae bacterium]